MNYSKLLFINILVFLFLFVISEIISANLTYNDVIFPHCNRKTNFHFYLPDYSGKLIADKNLYFDKQENLNDFPADNNKRPVIFMGCSYTYGSGIDKNQTISSAFQKYTKIKSDNVSFPGNGSTDTLFNLYYMDKYGLIGKNNENNYKNIVYVVMYDHILRYYSLALFSEYLSEYYKRHKNKSIKYHVLYYLNKLFITKVILGKYLASHQDLLFELEKYTVIKSNELIKKNIPDAKFIILLYDDVTGSNFTTKEQTASVQAENWKDMVKYGIDVVSTKDLIGDVLYKHEYQIEKEETQTWRPFHPNEKAWETIVPALAKYIQK